MKEELVFQFLSRFQFLCIHVPPITVIACLQVSGHDGTSLENPLPSPHREPLPSFSLSSLLSLADGLVGLLAIGPDVSSGRERRRSIFTLYTVSIKCCRFVLLQGLYLSSGASPIFYFITLNSGKFSQESSSSASFDNPLYRVQVGPHSYFIRNNNFPQFDLPHIPSHSPVNDSMTSETWSWTAAFLAHYFLFSPRESGQMPQADEGLKLLMFSCLISREDASIGRISTYLRILFRLFRNRVHIPLIYRREVTSILRDQIK